MNWGYFFAWAAAIFVMFFVTGWPVSPAFKGTWGSHYNALNLTYYGVLYLHYLLGPLFFSFLILGLFRNLIWKDNNGGNRQLAFLLAYSVLVAAVFALVLVHRFSPVEESDDGGVSEMQDANDDKALRELLRGRKLLRPAERLFVNVVFIALLMGGGISRDGVIDAYLVGMDVIQSCDQDDTTNALLDLQPGGDMSND
eukprot:CAMPEP_0119013716 /NCGR_PEP_ID=MMETSP1176-20130426/8813_1 /TAXON_ID=265551 /ORGANISM="Synedropsis recta cf, Strain CCMP1620" /LENGTH=197 /DNA_ID=CAMNT_0006966827 /DNA_START=125 /DNA_END=717 /DNA_ORIENTATION=+